ncbi:MYG1 [Culex quinquefasciatus]|uniref:MYG1 n=1 Tax=Culex quinquefasciatus TaxID=7176 RepID=B0WHB6_CULQU|nr:MYG1 [Culex quinquefasciatus]|eukprot:XP_001848100.1 MYG1 [Culex quinquefasciatus]
MISSWKPSRLCFAIKVDEGLDGETFFLYVFLAAVVVQLLVLGQRFLGTSIRLGMRRRTTSKTWPSALKRPKLRSPRSSSTRCFTTRTVGGRQGAIVEKAVRNRVEVHFCPCKEHLYELEGEHGIGGLPKYVIYFKRPNDWRVICVPLETASFVCHKWRGKRDNKLEEVSGTEGANFCHQTGFNGGNRTREGCAADCRGQSEGVRDIEKQRQAQAIADGAQETGTTNPKDVDFRQNVPQADPPAAKSEAGHQRRLNRFSRAQLISSSTVWIKPQHQQLATMQIVLDAFESDPNNVSVKIHRKLAPFRCGNPVNSIGILKQISIRIVYEFRFKCNSRYVNETGRCV